MIVDKKKALYIVQVQISLIRLELQNKNTDLYDLELLIKLGGLLKIKDHLLTRPIK